MHPRRLPAYVSVIYLTGGGVVVDQMSTQAGAVEVAGFGDKAGFLPSAGTLSIAVGADSYSIQVVKAGKPSNQADAVTVAEDVLGS